MNLPSLLPASETKAWLLLIWPRLSHCPGVRKSGAWLTAVFPLHFGLCIDSAILSDELNYFWPCGGIFIKVSKLWAVLWPEKLMCSVSVSGFTLGKWREKEKQPWMSHLPAGQVSLPRKQKPVLLPKSCAVYTVHIQNNMLFKIFHNLSNSQLVLNPFRPFT